MKYGDRVVCTSTTWLPGEAGMVIGWEKPFEAPGLPPAILTVTVRFDNPHGQIGTRDQNINISWLMPEEEWKLIQVTKGLT